MTVHSRRKISVFCTDPTSFSETNYMMLRYQGTYLGIGSTV